MAAGKIFDDDEYIAIYLFWVENGRDRMNSVGWGVAMIRRILCLLVCLLLPGAWGAASGLAVEGELASAAFWSHQAAGDKVLLDAAGVRDLNQWLQQNNRCLCNLRAYPAQVPAERLRAELSEGVPEWGSYYHGGQALSWAEYAQALANRGLDRVQPVTAVRYAVTVQRANLRLLPVAAGWFSSPEDVHYDDLQATAVDPSEALLVLQESSDGAFLFVQMRNYRGWIARDAIAFTDRDTWLQYVDMKDFLVVTANRYEAGGQLYQLGSRMRLKGRNDAGWQVVLPQRDARGRLAAVETVVPVSESVHQGYLAFTRNHLVQSAFRCLGDVYGWGGLEDSVDCSSFVADVYRTVGIELPRDADQQEQAFSQRLQLAGMDSRERLEALLTKAQPGDLLFRDGHVMLYLGQSAGEPYIIHSASSYYEPSDGGWAKVYIRRVVVSGVYFLNRRGMTNLDVLTSIGRL